MKIVGIAGQLNSGKDTAADYLVEKFGFVKVSFADPIKAIAKEAFNFDEHTLWGPSEARSTKWRFAHWPESKREEALTIIKGKIQTDYLFPNIYREIVLLHLGDILIKILNSDLTARSILQYLGTEWGRELDEDVWIKHVFRVAKQLSSNNHCIYNRAYSHLGCVIDNSIKYEIPPGIIISDLRFPNELKTLKEHGAYRILINRPETGGVGTQVGVPQHESESHQKDFQSKDFDVVINNDSTLESFMKKLESLGKDLTLPGRSLTLW